MKKPMTEQQRKKIKMHIKNGIDISDLIKDYSIKKEDLSGAKIKKLCRANDDMIGVNFTKCIIGEHGAINNISGAKLRNSRWCDCEVKGIMFARKTDFRDADLSGAMLPNVEYQYADFRGAKFCEICMRLGTDYGMGAKLNETFFADLTKGWNIVVREKTAEELKADGIKYD